MSSLTTLEKKRLENLFGMGGGYVLDLTNNTFAEFFRENADVNIYAGKYDINGDSKARRLRAFWEVEPDEVVGNVILQLLALWHYENPQPNAKESDNAEACTRTVERLLGRAVALETTETEFLKQDFGDASLSKIPIDGSLLPILESRLVEATRCLQADAPLALIFLCGSVLEGLLISVARAKPKEFNQAAGSPKRDGKVKPFNEWYLRELIDVAHELGYLGLDVLKHGHTLRDFRNYIHPFQQMSEHFNPDKHTARISLQVLKAAIADLSGERP
jgi:hypothetical protein